MVKRLIGVLVVGVAMVFGLYPFLLGPGQDERPLDALTQLVPAIGGFAPQEAEAILARHQAELRRLPGVLDVQLWLDGILVFTDNPEALPPDVEGLPVHPRATPRLTTSGGLPY